VLETEFGPKRNPATMIAKEMLQHMRAFLSSQWL
jgi:hypothetical protein